MIIVENKFAFIDADFYIKMRKYAADKGALFLQLMEDLGVQPVMHKFVTDIELKGDTYIQDMVKAGCIEDIYTYFCEEEGLGEIRSIYMAKKLGYEYFMSDDGGAKRLAKAFIKELNVFNVFGALMECKKIGTSITLKQLNPTITNVFRGETGYAEGAAGGLWGVEEMNNTNENNILSNYKFQKLTPNSYAHHLEKTRWEDDVHRYLHRCGAEWIFLCRAYGRSGSTGYCI